VKFSAGIDKLAALPPSYRGLVDDEEWLVYLVAHAIRSLDPDLRQMLDGQEIKSEDETMAICHAYARLVLGHENDENCDKIVHALISAGIPVREGTCR
jgi:hypothetical protein